MRPAQGLRLRLLGLDEFQHFVDARQVSIPNEVADWLKEQVEETGLAIVVLGLQRCLEVLKQNERLRRRFGATLRVGAFRWENKDDRTTYRAFLRAVQDQLPEYVMPLWRIWRWPSACTTVPTASSATR